MMCLAHGAADRLVLIDPTAMSIGSRTSQVLSMVGMPEASSLLRMSALTMVPVRMIPSGAAR